MPPPRQSSRRLGQLQTSSREAVRLGKRKIALEEPSTPIHNTSAASSPVQPSRSRACDGCRRRKTRCDSAEKPNSVCTNCMQAKRPCTFVQPSKPRGPPKAYITGLEDRVELLEEFLKHLRPDLDLTNELGSPIVRDSWKDPLDYTDPSSSRPLPSQRASKSTDPEPSVRKSSPSPYRDARRLPSPLTDDDDSDFSYDSDATDSPQDTTSASAFRRGLVLPAIENVEFKLKKLSLNGPTVLGPVAERQESDILLRYHGVSGGIESVRDAFKLQRHFNPHARHGVPEGEQPMKRPVRRSQFWRPTPWETRWEMQNQISPELLRKTLSTFPPLDLQQTLLDLYFVRHNTVYTLLHRPTFMRLWNDKFYERDIWFAGTCLGVFALASKWSDDPRVLPSGEEKLQGKDLDWRRSGFHYCKALLDIHVHCRSLLFPATLFEVQTYSLLVMYLRGTLLYLSAWTFNSFGLLKAQDVGAHLKSVYVGTPTVEQELWKRAFWNLVWNDRVLSHGLGRSCALGDESFDADYPVEVDDEYWENEEDSSKSFCQPPDVPCRITAFVLVMKLTPIMGIGLRSLYTSAESPSNSAFLKRKEKKSKMEVVAEMNKLLEEWLKTLPSYLQWGSSTDEVFSHLACNLQFTYFFVLFLTYRPFLPTAALHSDSQEEEHPALTAQALTILTDASKQTIDIIKFQMERGVWSSQSVVHASLLAAGISFLVLWHANYEYETLLAQGVEDVKPPTQLMEELMPFINIIFDALEWAGERWSLSLHVKDLFTELLPPSETLQMPSQVLRQESHMPPANPVGNDPRFDPYPWSGAPTTTLLPTQVEYHHQQPRHPNMRPVYEGTSRYPYDLDNNAMSSRMPERRASFSTRHLPTLLFTEQQSQPQEWRAPQQYDYVPEPSTSALYQGNSDHDSWEDERNLAYGVPHRTSNARTELPPIDTRHLADYPNRARQSFPVPDPNHILPPVHYSDHQQYHPR